MQTIYQINLTTKQYRILQVGAGSAIYVPDNGNDWAYLTATALQEVMRQVFRTLHVEGVEGLDKFKDFSAEDALLHAGMTRNETEPQVDED